MRKEMKKRVILTGVFVEIFLMISMTFALALFLNDNFVSGTFAEEIPSPSINPSGTTNNLFSLNKFDVSKASKFSDELTLADGNKVQFDGWRSADQKTYLSSDGKLYSTGDKGITFTGQNGYKPYKGPGGIFGDGIANPIYGNLAQGLVWSLGVVGGIMTIGSLLGFDPQLTKTLSISAVGGIMTGKLTVGLLQKNVDWLKMGSQGKYFGLFKTPGQTGFAVGALVTVALFVFMYKDTSTKTIKFQCLPFEAPLGGAKCEECNKDEFRACSEYRCKSLGQACQLLNPGTKEEKCTWVGRDDVKSPTITPWNAALKPQTNELKLVYAEDTAIRPPQIGTKIITSSKACLPAFTPLEFGILTNEPAQCKVDYNHTTKMEDMKYYFGDNNYFLYNHTQKMRLPSPNFLNASAPTIFNNGNFNLFVRCKDANGNENVDEYVFSFCVDKSQDTTPPIIENFSIPSGSYTTFGRDNVVIEAYVNEPAECKWSTLSKPYDEMENSMSCATSVDQFNADLQYTCKTNLTGIQNMQENKFYFKCKDQPGADEGNRNTMVASEELLLRGSQPLNILDVQPNDTITGSTDVVDVDLVLETDDGSENGRAICLFSNEQSLGSFVEMFSTDNYLHNQTLRLPSGDYTYYFRCIDSGGNIANSSTSFRVFVDKQAPIVTRLYREFEALKVVTDEDAECSYSQTNCNFNFADGTEMQYSATDIKNNLYAEWRPTQTYYIKCKDQYSNEPSPNVCSIIAMPIELTNKTA